jgi:hypothetical protein
MSNIYDKSSLVLIPSGTKTGKIFSQKPVSGDGDFTFTRASAATRVNADGNIEKETINIFRYSEEFNQGSAWSKQGGAQISPNASTAPDGTNTADLLYPSISGVVKAAIQSFTSASGTQYAQSIYVKASGKNFAALYALNGNAGPAMWVNLTTGAITNGSTPNVVGRFATSVGDGWWRIGFADLGNGGIGYMHIYPTDTAGSQNVTANGTDGILIWGGQLNYGSVAQEYIKTTTAAVYGGITDNTPRLDYTDSSCPALLLEPLRTNNVPHSEYHQGTIAAVTRTYNTSDTLSPEGVYNAVKYEVNANNSDPYLRVFNIPTSGNSATFSLYVKGASGQLFSMILGRDGYNELEYEAFSLDGTWQRLDISKTFTTTPTTLTIGAEFSHSSDDGVLGQEYYLYGLQVEAASYATSYIPTYGSSVSRVAETCQVENESALINSEQGTMYFEGIAIDPVFANVLSFSDGTNNNRICLTLPQSATSINVFSSVAGSKINNNITHDPSINSKYAIVWNGNSFKVFVNGVKEVDNTMAGSFSANTLTDIRFDRGDGGLNFGGFCKSYLSIASALTDQEAIDLTTI